MNAALLPFREGYVNPFGRWFGITCRKTGMRLRFELEHGSNPATFKVTHGDLPRDFSHVMMLKGRPSVLVSWISPTRVVVVGA